jgi:hypothetical protein
MFVKAYWGRHVPWDFQGGYQEGIEEKSVKGENSRHSTSVEAAKYKELVSKNLKRGRHIQDTQITVGTRNQIVKFEMMLSSKF